MNRKQLIAIVALLAMMLCLPIKAAKTYWGYCNGVDPVAFGTKNTGKCAIYIPADVAQVYKGFTVSAVKYGLAAQASNVEVFITKDLNADPIVTKKATVSNLYKGWNEVALTTPYEIDGEGFYIGYSYSGSAVSMGVTSTFSENACWADLGDGWKTTPPRWVRQLRHLPFRHASLATTSRSTSCSTPRMQISQCRKVSLASSISR